MATSWAMGVTVSPKRANSLFRLEDIHHVEAVLALPGQMNQEAVKRQVRKGLDAAFALREPLDHFLILLLGKAGLPGGRP